MHRITPLLNAWPVLMAVLISAAMIVSAAEKDVTLPPWLIEFFTQEPEDKPEPAPVPKSKSAHAVPYAPVPGRDDRTPLAYVGHVFELDDPDLPAKLSGVGPVYWAHGGRGSGALIAPDVVLTTGHLFAAKGKWEGPHGLSHKPPSPSDGYIYLEACAQSYPLKAIHMGSMAPRAGLGLDYAIVELAAPACPEAAVLPVALTPEDLVGAEDQIFLNMGSYAFSDITRFATHPIFSGKAARTTSYERQAVFGVRCTPTGRDDTGSVADGSTAVIVTEGCGGVPGGSGGPVVLSRDGGATYSIVGVANSYRAKTEYNNYTSIEGAFAKHLSGFVDLTQMPAAPSATATPQSHITTRDPLGPWEAMQQMEDGE